MQRGHYYAIVDEVDSILIDEARTPLIISGEGDNPTDLGKLAERVLCGRGPEGHASWPSRTTKRTWTSRWTAIMLWTRKKDGTLTASGIAKAEK